MYEFEGIKLNFFEAGEHPPSPLDFKAVLTNALTKLEIEFLERMSPYFGAKSVPKPLQIDLRPMISIAGADDERIYLWYIDDKAGRLQKYPLFLKQSR